ncbi:hypothetical protein C1645_816997 [Glomus cerebriforme]|uniref:Uncharacterized protein n=1 Tax=Glomus cerebriforme TaxID=658196 RepID=A0A397TJR6_9GLOM|nr:hypothetical protein C1645_816997 [Glomus cerebriforme]
MDILCQKKDNDGNKVMAFICRNSGLRASLGQLQQVGTLAGSAWTGKPENPAAPCRFILPDDQPDERKDALPIFEIITSETNRYHVSESLDFEISYMDTPDNPNDLVRYVKKSLVEMVEKEVKISSPMEWVVELDELLLKLMIIDTYCNFHQPSSQINIQP